MRQLTALLTRAAISPPPSVTAPWAPKPAAERLREEGGHTGLTEPRPRDPSAHALTLSLLWLYGCKEDLTDEKNTWAASTAAWATRLAAVKQGHAALDARVKGLPSLEGTALQAEKAAVEKQVATALALADAVAVAIELHPHLTSCLRIACSSCWRSASDFGYRILSAVHAVGVDSSAVPVRG